MMTLLTQVEFEDGRLLPSLRDIRQFVLLERKRDGHRCSPAYYELWRTPTVPRAQLQLTQRRRGARCASTAVAGTRAASRRAT
jgi:hypothetical protein